MTVALRYVSSPAAVMPQSYYSAASSGFTTYGPQGDGTQPPGTAYVQSITLAASPWNVVDVNATTWLASWITAYAADPLWSQVAINADIFPPPSAVPGTVVPPVLEAPLFITVTPAAPSIANGLTQQFTATGVYASGNMNLTNIATWASSATGKATIAAGGLATSVAVGSATITATFEGVVGSATLTVGAATLVSIAVTPPTASIAPLATQQYTATGTYTDTTTQNLTSTATWASDNHLFATIAAGGLATGVADGVANITAQSGVITSPSVALTVTG
jgi:hypothetical protein